MATDFPDPRVGGGAVGARGGRRFAGVFRTLSGDREVFRGSFRADMGVGAACADIVRIVPKQLNSPESGD